MKLDLGDKRLAARISGLADGRDRLVLDYPLEYREAVHSAFADLLRPPGGQPILGRIERLEGRIEVLATALGSLEITVAGLRRSTERTDG